MRILISNDDGVHAEGIHALAEEFRKDHQVYVVAPERERSTTGHSLTLHKPLRLHRWGREVYSVSGGPADCIYVGLGEVMKGKKPDLVLSGINNGANLGQDVFYSGTASAAREAANLGIPSVAVSLSLDHAKPGKPKHFATAAKAVRASLNQVLPAFAGKANASWKTGLNAWPKGMMLNINVPNVAEKKLKGYRLASQGRRIYGTEILRRIDARGREYFWIGGKYQSYDPNPETDCWQVDHGYVSVTPLELDTTMQEVFHSLQFAFELKNKRSGPKRR
ncbi:MAG: 5'/3'-nucleotidase SurE [Bacteriovoracia bacterium]